MIDEYDRNIWFFVALAGKYNILKLAKEKYPVIDFNHKDYYGSTIWFYLAESENYESFKLAVKEQNIDLNYENNECCTAMTHMGYSFNYDIVKLAINDFNLDHHDKRIWIFLWSKYFVNEDAAKRAIEDFNLTTNEIPERFHHFIKDDIQTLLKTKNYTLENVPHKYICPISKEIIHDPVVISSGHIYDRLSITEWFKDHDTDPVTNTIIVNKTMTPVIFLKTEIKEYIERL
jgi:hypothetical protein